MNEIVRTENGITTLAKKSPPKTADDHAKRLAGPLRPSMTNGPGQELRNSLSWLAQSRSRQTAARIATMNVWGAAGCRTHLDEIAGWLVQQARKIGYDAGSVDFQTARALVLSAIARFERNYPDGFWVASVADPSGNRRTRGLETHDQLGCADQVVDLPETDLDDVQNPLIVQRCFLVNLDKRNDRLTEWMDQLPDPWPLPKPERFAAIDGRCVPPPEHWRAGPGAWGCYRSHCLILEKCLAEGIDSYVVFEDDAGFGDDFAKHLKTFVNELPDDWGLAYLGGQHLHTVDHPPVQVSPHVYRPYNVNRTHAFMVRGRANMIALYHHLHSRDWRGGNHIDHHLGRLVEGQYKAAEQKTKTSTSISVYVPDRWMVGQLPTRSNISWRRWTTTRFFNDAASVDHQDQPFFAVLGPHRSGTSCVAMIMHHLGVHMGNRLTGFEATGGGEASGLAKLCENAMRFPATDPTISDEELTCQLQKYIVSKKSEAVRDETIAGAKYPHLCRFAKQIHSVAGDSLRIVSVERDIESSIRSLQSRSQKNGKRWYATDDDSCRRLQLALLQHRENFIASHPSVPVHRVNFAALTSNPNIEIARLVKFLGIVPSEDQMKAALAHINPSLRKH